MGVKISSAEKNCTNRKPDKNQILPGMTPVVCQRCGRRIGQVFSTDGIVTCDKCGKRSYTLIDAGVVVILPPSYLEVEGVYDDTNDYSHKVRARINENQFLIREPVFEID